MEENYTITIPVQAKANELKQLVLELQSVLGLETIIVVDKNGKPVDL